jgi:hypothetical protein
LTSPSSRELSDEIVEHCELMIEESIETQRAIAAGEPHKNPSFRGEAYDAAYAQGRKDACRVILLVVDPHHGPGPTSTGPGRRSD